MKLISFTTEKVYGYLNFNIIFNDDLTFLVGGNGSGKTTALKLIHALMTPNLKDLCTIPYDNLNLTFEDNEQIINIEVNKNEKTLLIKISNSNEILTLPTIDDDELDYILSRDERSEEYFNEIAIKHKDNKVLESINNLNVPIFLGLERRNLNNEDKIDYFNHRDRLYSHSNNERQRLFNRNKYISGSLGVSLMETQLVVQQAYRKIRNLEEHQRRRLRDQIISSSFYYTDFSNYLEEGGELKLPTWKDKAHIIKRRDEIETVIKNLGTKVEKFQVDIDKFFNQIDELFENMQKKDKNEGIHIEWIINLAQIDRISKLIELIDKNRARIDTYFKPIDTFLNIINHFLNDSKKNIEIDSIGHLKIRKPNGMFGNIESLSSGERQLLIMFAHLIFNNDAKMKNIFIIDEPELSLHLKWQEEFVQYALELSNNTQLIMATHSPEIIVGNEDKIVLTSES